MENSTGNAELRAAAAVCLELGLHRAATLLFNAGYPDPFVNVRNVKTLAEVVRRLAAAFLGDKSLAQTFAWFFKTHTSHLYATLSTQSSFNNTWSYYNHVKHELLYHLQESKKDRTCLGARTVYPASLSKDWY